MAPVYNFKLFKDQIVTEMSLKFIHLNQADRKIDDLVWTYSICQSWKAYLIESIHRVYLNNPAKIF